MTIRQRYEGIISIFKEIMPEPKTELHYDTPFHLLLAVILSAQCTDKRINMVTPALFERFPDPESLAAANEDEVFEYIKSVTFPNNKARHLIRAARVLTEEFGGEMPTDIDNLMKLPGVGRKTANVMLAVVWNKAAMAVDTHVFRVSNRLGLTNNSKTPLETEKTQIGREIYSRGIAFNRASLADPSWQICMQGASTGLSRLSTSGLLQELQGVTVSWKL